MFEWAPDGEHFFTATTAPRLRIDNCYRLWHYSGKMIYEKTFDSPKEELWQVCPIAASLLLVGKIFLQMNSIVRLHSVYFLSLCNFYLLVPLFDSICLFPPLHVIMNKNHKNAFSGGLLSESQLPEVRGPRAHQIRSSAVRSAYQEEGMHVHSTHFALK